MRRIRTRILATVAVVAAGVTAWIALPASADTAPLPFAITNDTGRSEPVYLYVLGTDLATGKLGYADRSGHFTPWTGGATVPVPAPDVSIPVAAGGSTVQVPRGMSGRIYFSFGQKLDFRLTTDGLVQPAPWAGGRRSSTSSRRTPTSRAAS